VTTFSSKKQRRERALQHVLAYTRKRVREQPLELEWATHGADLPGKVPVPPEWVRKAILRVTETGLSPVFRVRPGDPKESHANLLRMIGMVQAQLALLQAPDAMVSDQYAELKTFAKTAANQILRDSQSKVKAFTKILGRLYKRTPPASLQQLQENQELLRQGLHGLIDPNGELVKGRSAKAKIYGYLWFHWPQLSGLRNAAQIHEAIEAVTEDKFSTKTIEAVCSELGIFRGRRGRPRAKKFLGPGAPA
jgi:hypothetical protein